MKPAPSNEPSTAFRDFEKAAHDRMAGSYEKAFTPVSDHAIEHLLRAARVGPGTRFLDVAAGPGRLAAQAAERGAEVTGVDLSSEMVALARQKHPELRFQEGSAEALPFDSAVFDAVACAFGLGHFAEPETAMCEMVRILKPGGRVALSWWQGFSRNRINGIFFDVIQRLQIPAASVLPAGPAVDRFSEAVSLTGLLAGAGLVEIEVEGISSVHHLPGVEDLWSLALGSFARASTVILAQNAENRARIQEAVNEEARPYLSKEGLAIPIAFFVAAGQRP